MVLQNVHLKYFTRLVGLTNWDYFHVIFALWTQMYCKTRRHPVLNGSCQFTSCESWIEILNLLLHSWKPEIMLTRRHYDNKTGGKILSIIFCIVKLWYFISLLVIHLSLILNFVCKLFVYVHLLCKYVISLWN